MDRMNAAGLYYDAMRLQRENSSADFIKHYPGHYKAWKQIVAHRMRQDGD